MKNKIIIFIIGVLIGTVITMFGFSIYNKNVLRNRQQPPMMGEQGKMPMGEKRPDGNFNPMEKEVQKETTASDVKAGENVEEKELDLSKYDSNITITESGEYTLKGEFKNTILINSEDTVTLNLNGVNIKNEITSAIANIGKGELILKLADDSTNIVSDGGSSEYDACIYSSQNLTIDGNGTLNVYGNQEEGEGIATETSNITINNGKINIECQDDGLNAGGDGGTITINGGDVIIKANGDGIDSNKNLIINGGYVYTIGSSVGGDAGIDTDGGFEINGGTVIALGSDMLQKPEKTSKQKSICFNLNNKISTGTKISLKNEKQEEIISFEAKEDFKTLVLSNQKLKDEIYYIYANSEKTDYKSNAE